MWSRSQNQLGTLTNASVDKTFLSEIGNILGCDGQWIFKNVCPVGLYAIFWEPWRLREVSSRVRGSFSWHCSIGMSHRPPDERFPMSLQSSGLPPSFVLTLVYLAFCCQLISSPRFCCQLLSLPCFCCQPLSLLRFCCQLISFPHISSSLILGFGFQGFWIHRI